jgi:hypothetical protein
VTATDDGRAAAQIRVSLSTQVIAACLAGVAAEAVLVTFVFQFRTLGWLFGTVAFLAGALFGVSIFAGMRFVAEISTSGYNRTWSAEVGVAWYYAQATLGGLGFILVVASAIVAGRPPERHDTVVVPSSVVWFNRTWGRDDRRPFEREFHMKHSSEPTAVAQRALATLYACHPTLRKVLGIAPPRETDEARLCKTAAADH